MLFFFHFRNFNALTTSGKEIRFFFLLERMKYLKIQTAVSIHIISTINMDENQIIPLYLILLFYMKCRWKIKCLGRNIILKKKKFQDSTSSCFQSGNNIICLTISNILWYKEKKTNEAKQQKKKKLFHC